MNNRKAIFEAYGADYQNTMDRFMGNESLYLRILEMLFADENLQKLGNALSNQEYPAAFEAAHTLKGVVGNLGLTPLYDAVCAVVEPLRAGEWREDYSFRYQAVVQQFEAARAFCEALKKGE